ncbi:SNF2 family N-terminal domain-containing protein [Flammula alnicola]|nr:SNF2 family N-terminal domain-containing protein [Flammula alnicola]
MSTSHVVGYSKSTRAKCHAPPPCKDTLMPVGTLRYGRTVANEIGETVEWRHWGCITPAILTQLASIPERSINGFENLNKRRMAAPTVNGSPALKKRKAAQAGLSQPSQMATSAILAHQVRDELYCNMTTSVVGIQYYKGSNFYRHGWTGRRSPLVREPQNPYDRNAIQVKNISRVQVGHLPRNVASKLAPLLDRRVVTVEGVINDGNIGSRGYTLSITLKFYGPSDKRSELEPSLIWATPGQRGFTTTNASSRGSSSALASGRTGSMAPIPMPTPSSSSQRPANAAQTAAQREAIHKQQEALQKAAELRQMLNNLEKVDDESRRGSLLDTLCSTEDVLNMPLQANPPGIASGELSVDLLKHQNPTLPKKEMDKPVQFWQLRKQGNKVIFLSPFFATKTPQETPPLLGRGALCADAMGLGKTLTMIALILATKKEIDPGFSNATLIVAPLSVLSNWEKQLLDHCTPGMLSTCVYYGPNRGLSAADLQKYDVVITTYQIVAGEHDDGPNGAGAPSKKKKRQAKNLFEARWKRVILDEGHNIRNPKTKMAKAVVALDASRRWVLTGTPIDLGSLLTFLQICRPLDNEDFYKRLLLRPLKNGETSGVELLRALMSHICIRRTKEMQDSDGKSIIELPPVTLSLKTGIQHLYDEVEQASKQRLENFMNAGAINMVQSNALSMLTRMRQIALHPGLVPAKYLEELRSVEKSRLQDLLAQAIEDCEECPICFSVLPNDARITTCAHIFCLACITEILSRSSTCPIDRRVLTPGDLHEPPPPTDLTQKPSRSIDEDEPEGIRAGSSAKIDQLVHLLKLTPGTEKSLVFSQFTSFLDKITEALKRKGIIPYVRFDGQMSAKRRQEAIARFSVPLEEEAPVLPRSTRKARNTGATVLQDEDDPTVIFDDFIDDDDDDGPFAGRNPSQRKGQGKGCRSSRKSSEFCGSDENPRVMLLSLKAGALGLNLTVANNVYLWWQEGIESQAVDRVNRIGQKKPVHVYQLIAENTVESKVLEIQEKKKQLIQQAFSGIKRTETQRQQREARLQDLQNSQAS